MKRKIVILLLPLILWACSDEVPMVNLGIDDVYYVARMQKLPLHSALTGEKYRWTVNGKEVSATDSYIFLAEAEGVYNLTFDIIDPDTPYHFEFTVNVLHEEVEYSTYISRVYEYCPAPGQFVNEMPKYEPGDTYADILKKCEESISGTNDVLISLGGYGGYVTFGFDHTVINVPGERDFRIWGNAFYELSNPDHGNMFNQDPMRVRRLLAHKSEIRRLHQQCKLQGYTLVPLSLYFKHGRVKMEVGLCKGKKLYDKRADAAQRDAKRSIDRAMKSNGKYY